MPKVLLLATLIGALLPGASAQTITTGEVAGVVADSSGAVVPNATLILRNVETGDLRTLRSNAEGAYRFTFMRPGPYQISAVAAGLKSDIGSLQVGVGQVQVLNLTLKLEATKEVVLVNDAAPLLQTDNANMASTFSTTQLELLPNPGGDLTTIAFTVPGVVVNTSYGYGNFTSHGLPSISNLFTVNGVDNMNPYYNTNNAGATGLLLGTNEVREATVVQIAYEGHYGRLGGAQVNYVSKSGSNQYHGNLANSYNGSALNANDFFANATGTPRTHGVSNQYAASVSGPVFRDKLFFFANTEGLRYALPVFGGVVSVPSQALQEHIQRTLPAAQVPLYQKAFSLYNGAAGHERAAAVANGNGPLQDRQGKLGCGSLAGTAAVQGGVFGTNVSCADAFGINTPNQTSEWLLSTRVDYTHSDRQKAFFRFKTDHSLLLGYADPINPVFNGVSHQPDYEGQVNHTAVLGTRLVNNFIGAASYFSYVLAPDDLSAAYQAFPFRFTIFDGGATGMTGVGLQPGLPQGIRTGQLQLEDDISYSAGRHSLKAGLNYRYQRVSDVNGEQLARIGLYRFFRLDELAAGVINPASGSVYVQRFARVPVAHLRLSNLGFYVQDQWTVTAALKVTAALRLEHNGNPYCVDRCYARLKAPFTELEKGLNLPYNQSIQAGLAHAFSDTEALLLQPRLGVAYSPPWSKNTVLRGGIGLFSDVYPAALASSLASNAPNIFQTNIRQGTVNTGGPGSSPPVAIASANAFASGFAGGATLPQLQQAVAPAPFSPPGYFSPSAIVRNPKFLKWSFEVQRQWGNGNVLTVSYVGNRGYDLFMRKDAANGYANPASYPQGFGGLPAVVPDARFALINDISNRGYSNFNGLTVSWRRGLGHGFQGRLGYTWSHALDVMSNGGPVPFSYASLPVQIDPYNLRSLNYSNADYDVRHNLTGDFVWEIPATFQNRLARGLLQGWAAAGKVYAHSGMPFSVFNTAIAGRLSSTMGGVVLAALQDPTVHTSCGRSAVDTPCFSAGQFATTATQANFGNLPRNSFRGPGYFDLDSSLHKTVSVRERMRVILGASAYNLLNHANFAQPGFNVVGGGLGLLSRTANSPTSPYGRFQGSAVSGRVVVVTGKFVF